MVRIAHIGLGKTATTTLQKVIFPKLAKSLDFVFNDSELRKLLIKSTYVPLSVCEATKVKEILQQKRNLISLESLINWNPALWESAADRNLDTLGRETKILITLRDPLDWMTSVYQQKIHEGNVMEPHSFFLPENRYLRISNMMSVGKLEYFCPDYVDFKKLIALYRDRFETVECVDLKNIRDMKFMERLLPIDKEYRKELSEAFISEKYENRSYSGRAMSLTMKREHFLNFFGKKSFGSSDRRFEQTEALWLEEARSVQPYYSLTTSQKIIQFPIRLLRKFFRIFLQSWRGFIQNYFDKIIPYKKYVLPSSTYINEVAIDENRKFLRDLASK